MSSVHTELVGATVVLARERPFRLGAVEVRPSTREVIGPRGRQVLEPRVMQVLVALAQAEGEILARDDLIARCWDGRAVSEDAISRVISRLRRLSEDLGWKLETVTKVGYRLLPAGFDPEAPPRRAPAGDGIPRRRLVLTLGAAAGAAAVAGGLVWSRRQASTPPHARMLYERGRDALRQNLPEQVSHATGFLREAVVEAPDYAPAWGALALAYQTSLLYTAPERQEGVTAQAHAAAQRALDLDPDEPDATAALALLAPLYAHWGRTEPLYQRALALHPRLPAVEAAYARLLTSVGRMRDAVVHAETAVAGDDFTPWFRYLLGTCLWGAGRLEEAERALGKGLARWPRYYALWFMQFYLLAHTGRADQALAMAADPASRPLGIPAADVELGVSGARAMLTRSPQDIARAVQTQLRFAQLGTGYAENAIAWMSNLGRLDDAYRIANGLYFDEGFRVAERRFSEDQQRFAIRGERPTYQLFLPPTRAMRRDERFLPLAERVGLVRYWRAAGRWPDDAAWARAGS